MSSLTERGILMERRTRWKGWVPLITQQQRLRSVIKVMAYNIDIGDDVPNRQDLVKISYYYTLHLSVLSPPFFTSEKLECENPKWGEMQVDHQNGSVKGVVIRLWANINDESDIMITVWGVNFSGLIYIERSLLNQVPSALGPNSFVFHMHGGYFTAPHCLINPSQIPPQLLSVECSASEVKPSYTVKDLLRLQSIQQEMKKQTAANILLRNQIAEGSIVKDDENIIKGRGGATLRKLLSKPTVPRAHPEKILAVKKKIEMAKFRIQMLNSKIDRKKSQVDKLALAKNELQEQNQEKDIELFEKYRILQEDIDKGREVNQQLIEMRSQLLLKTTKLDQRRKLLMSELSIIYPIKQSKEGIYTIRDVPLANSEEFDGKDEVETAVALGFVAHLVQTMAFFLNVPTRYPICHFGSRSKIIDHIIVLKPDEDREFPLYSRGKEKHFFDYGVYLLNKNIAQLRWYCGLQTADLRPTLSNLAALMTLNKKQEFIPLTRDWIPERERTPVSYSLDRGLDSAASSITSLKERRPRYDTAPTVHDLASLMSLDITCKSYESINGSRRNLYGDTSIDDSLCKNDSVL